MKIVFVILVSLVLVACGGGETGNSSTGSINGFVTSNVDGSILEDVTVSIDNESTLTDSNGAYLIDGVNVGKKNIEASKEGYEPYSGEINITENFTSSFSIVLNKRDPIIILTGERRLKIYEYVYQFSLVDASSATMSGTWASDDGAIITLNGNRIVDRQGGNFSELNSFEVIDSTFFVNGENTITLLIENVLGSTEIYFSASVNY